MNHHIDRSSAEDHAGGIRALLDRARSLLTINPRSALAAAEDALRNAREYSSDTLAAQALHLIADAQAIRSRFPRSLNAALEARNIYRRVEDRAAERAILITIGTCYRRLDRYAEAGSAFQESLDLGEHDGNRGLDAEALCGLGLVALGHRDIEGARRYFARSIETGRAAGAPAAVAAALQGVGLSHFICSEWHRALEWYEQALAAARPTRNLPLITHIRCNIATSALHVGDIGRALHMEQHNLRVLERLGDRRALRIVLNTLSVMYRSLGRYDEALKAQIRSLAIAEQIGDRRGMVVVLSNLGGLYELFGDDAAALEYFVRAQNIAFDIDDAPLQVLALEHVIKNYRRLGARSKALMYALHALRLARRGNDRYGEQTILNLLGLIHMDAGLYDKAEEYLEHAVSVARSTATLELESFLLQSLATVAERRGRPEQAREYLEQGYAIALGNHHEEQCHELLGRLADLCQHTGDHQRSAAYRRAYHRSASTIFSEERMERLRRRAADFEHSLCRSEGAILNLAAPELDAVVEMKDRDIETRFWKLRPDSESTLRPHGSLPREIDATGHPDASGSGGVAPRSDRPRYRVEAFGALRLWVNDREIVGAPWGRKRARDLFKLLLVRYRRPVTIEEIIEHLWEGNIAEGTELLVMNAISHLRRVLEPGRRAHARSLAIPGINRTYLLDLGDDAAIDVVMFREALAEARRTDDLREKVTHYRRAIALYRDDLLKEDCYADWAASERELLKDAYLGALESAGCHALQLREHDAALDAARRLLEIDSTSIEGYRIMLGALREEGRERDIPLVYTRCRDAFEREYGGEIPAHLLTLFGMVSPT